MPEGSLRRAPFPDAPENAPPDDACSPGHAMPDFFPITAEALETLSRRDKRLAALIERVGPLRREVHPDPFAALLHSIAGQQISMKAQETVWRRLRALAEARGGLSPRVVAALPEDSLRSAGLSARKVAYMQAAADAFAQGRLSADFLRAADDAAVCAALTALPGVGLWTAEMLLIFSLQRPDVFSRGDLAIRRGLCRLHHHKEMPPQRFERYRRRYSPYGSTASLYLWALAGDETLCV